MSKSSIYTKKVYPIEGRLDFVKFVSIKDGEVAKDYKDEEMYWDNKEQADRITDALIEVAKKDEKPKEPKTSTHFRLADSTHPMYHPETFETLEEAIEVLDKEYVNRSKGNRYDTYWRSRTTTIQKVTTTIEDVYFG